MLQNPFVHKNMCVCVLFLCCGVDSPSVVVAVDFLFTLHMKERHLHTSVSGIAHLL